MSIPPEMPLGHPFFLAVGRAYYFTESPTHVRMPEPPNPGASLSIVLEHGGSLDISDDKGEHLENLSLGAGELVNFTYVNRQRGWMHLKI